MKKILLSLSTAAILFFGFSSSTFAAGNTYQVKKGDTLWAIALKNHVTVQQIKTWNNLKSDIIKPNQVLRLNANTVTQSSVSKPASTPNYRAITVRATAYTASCKGCSGITYTGINLKKNPNAKVISVDPNVIPLGSKVYVPGYGDAIAGDKGSAIRGNRIDIFIPNYTKAIQWGSRTVTIKVYK